MLVLGFLEDLSWPLDCPCSRDLWLGCNLYIESALSCHNDMGDFGTSSPDVLSLRVKSVAVIGAGPSGLAAARLVTPYVAVVKG